MCCDSWGHKESDIKGYLPNINRSFPDSDITEATFCISYISGH